MDPNMESGNVTLNILKHSKNDQYLELLNLLISKGFNVNNKFHDSDEETYLSCIIKGHNWEMAKTLIFEGIKVHIRNLDEALQNDNFEIFKLIFPRIRKVDIINQINIQGYNFLDRVIEKHKTDWIIFLLKNDILPREKKHKIWVLQEFKSKLSRSQVRELSF